MRHPSSSHRLAHRRPHFAGTLAVGLILSGAMVGSAHAARLTLEVVDDGGQRTAARVRIVDDDGLVPDGPDPVRLSHGSLGGYFYTTGILAIDVADGPITLDVGKGFEWRAQTLELDLTEDLAVTVTLERMIDMRAEGWFGGDVHTHSQHPPLEYTISPAIAHRVARAEDLAMMWLLDQTYEFTGTEHALSDDAATLYYSTEYRNQVYGHAALLGLTEFIDYGCCWPGAPATPMLQQLHDDWNPGPGQALVLCHAHNTDDFWDDVGWPGNGLGRGLPTLAALGGLDALDLMAYSNDPEVYVDDWYRLLSTGLRIPPSAGTDSGFDDYWSKPPGGYRVFVYEGAGNHSATSWVDGLTAGRSFVSNYPLIPAFTVGDSLAGSEIALEAFQVLPISARVVCTEPLDVAEVVVNGSVIHSIALDGGPAGTDQLIETDVFMFTSGWVALRATGGTSRWHPVTEGGTLVAHTAPVYVTLGGEEVRSSADAVPMLDWLDDLQTFVLDRGEWDTDPQRDAVLTLIDAARAPFLDDFVHPPGPFGLLLPAEGDSLDPGAPITFGWETPVDDDPGDEVRFLLEIASDPGFTADLLALDAATSTFVLPSFTLPEEVTRYWRVTAIDRGGLTSTSTPGARVLHLKESTVVGVPGSAAATIVGPRAWPSPTRGSVTVRFATADDAPTIRVRIRDVAGRLVQEIAVSGPSVDWDARDRHERPVAPGRYWIEGRTSDGTSLGVIAVTVLR